MKVRGHWIQAVLIIAVAHGSLKAADSLPVDLLDPVPTLLCGAGIVKDTDTLASGGRKVVGLATDGVARIVVRIGGVAAGQQVTVTLLNDRDAQSTSSDEDGGLGAVGDAAFNKSSLQVDGVQTKNGVFAFAVYRAALDFARNSNDFDQKSRSVSLKIQPKGGAASTVEVILIRPALDLIHGLWGDPTAWRFFRKLQTDARFKTALDRYDFTFPLAASTPGYPKEVLTDQNVPRSNSLGFNFNARTVIPQVENHITQFKNGMNPIAMPVAAVQAEMIAHSMGGVVTRTMPLIPGFFNAQNYDAGLIHKLITIGTPHLGSPLAIALLDDKNACVRNILAVGNNFSFGSAVLLGPLFPPPVPILIPVNGAVGDLQGDGKGNNLSPALAALTKQIQGRPPIPTGMIAGGMAAANLASLTCTRANRFVPCNVADSIRSACGNAPLAQKLTPADWPGVLGGGPADSDGIVPVTSQVAGGQVRFAFGGVVHSEGLTSLSFTGPFELGDPRFESRVIDLLNTFVNTPKVFIPLTP